MASISVPRMCGRSNLYSPLLGALGPSPFYEIGLGAPFLCGHVVDVTADKRRHEDGPGHPQSLVKGRTKGVPSCSSFIALVMARISTSFVDY